MWVLLPGNVSMVFQHTIKRDSLNVSRIRKIVPIYFVKILKAVTELSVNRLKNAAFLSTFETENMFSFPLWTLLFQRHLLKDRYGNRVALTFYCHPCHFKLGVFLD